MERISQGIRTKARDYAVCEQHSLWIKLYTLLLIDGVPDSPT